MERKGGKRNLYAKRKITIKSVRIWRRLSTDKSIGTRRFWWWRWCEMIKTSHAFWHLPNFLSSLTTFSTTYCLLRATIALRRGNIYLLNSSSLWMGSITSHRKFDPVYVVCKTHFSFLSQRFITHARIRDHSLCLHIGRIRTPLRSDL